jgi:hypothetical protein
MKSQIYWFKISANLKALSLKLTFKRNVRVVEINGGNWLELAGGYQVVWDN